MTNPHSQYIDKRIKDFMKSEMWNVNIVNTSHDNFIKCFSRTIFTNVVMWTFTSSYLKKHPCSDCKGLSKDRCHGIGEERPVLIKRALERVYPDTTKTIVLKEIIIAFLEEHKSTKFTFKCSKCHRSEQSSTNSTWPVEVVQN
jgi:hypothetical protein